MKELDKSGPWGVAGVMLTKQRLAFYWLEFLWSWIIWAAQGQVGLPAAFPEVI